MLNPHHNFLTHPQYVHFRDKAQGPRLSHQPYGQLTSSTPELRAQLNLTRNHQKKKTTPKVVCLPGSSLMECMTVMSVCQLLEQYPKNEMLLQLQTTTLAALEKVGPRTAARCSTRRLRQGEKLKAERQFHFTSTNY